MFLCSLDKNKKSGVREQQDPISGFLPLKQLLDVDTLGMGRGGITANKQLDENATMTALAANMCLAVCKSVGKENAALFVSMGQSMMEMLQKSGPLSLVNSNINQGNSSMIVHTVNSIFDYAQQVSNSYSCLTSSHAVSLLISFVLIKLFLIDTPMTSYDFHNRRPKRVAVRQNP